MVNEVSSNYGYIGNRITSGFSGMNSLNNGDINKIPYNISNTGFPVVNKVIQGAEGANSSLGSQIAGWFAFDLGLKTLGLIWSKIRRNNSKSLIDRYFTPNIIGHGLGSDAAASIKNKVLPDIFKHPNKTLKDTAARVVLEKSGEKAASKSLASMLLKSSGFVGWIIMGSISSVFDIYNAFQQSPMSGFKQVGKTIVNQSINATAFCSGELVGSTIGAIIGGSIGGGIIGAKVGGWFGGIVGGCIASYFADKKISQPLGLTSGPDKQPSSETSSDKAAKKVLDRNV